MPSSFVKLWLEQTEIPASKHLEFLPSVCKLPYHSRHFRFWDIPTNFTFPLPANTCEVISAPFIFKTVTIPVDGVGNIASLALLTLKNYGHFTKELKLLVRTLTCAREECFFFSDDHSQGVAEIAAEKDGRRISTDAITLLAQRRTLLPGLKRLVVEYPETLGDHESAYLDQALEADCPEADVGRRNSVAGHALFSSIVESTGPPYLASLAHFSIRRGWNSTRSSSQDTYREFSRAAWRRLLQAFAVPKTTKD